MDYIISQMLTYIIFFIISLLFSFIDFAKINPIRKRGIFIFFTIGIIIFIGGRFYCDNDYTNYIYFFNETPPLHKMDYSTFMGIYLLYQVEPLFFLFSSIFKMIGLGGQSIIFFYTICTFTFFFYFYTPNIFFPIYFSFSIFNLLFFITFYANEIWISLVLLYLCNIKIKQWTITLLLDMANNSNTISFYSIGRFYIFLH